MSIISCSEIDCSDGGDVVVIDEIKHLEIYLTDILEYHFTSHHQLLPVLQSWLKTYLLHMSFLPWTLPLSNGFSPFTISSEIYRFVVV